MLEERIGLIADCQCANCRSRINCREAHEQRPSEKAEAAIPGIIFMGIFIFCGSPQLLPWRLNSLCLHQQSTRRLRFEMSRVEQGIDAVIMLERGLPTP